ALTGQHHDRKEPRRRIGSNGFQDLLPAAIRKMQIQQDEIRGLALDSLQRQIGQAELLDSVAAGRQELFQETPNLRIVVHNVDVSGGGVGSVSGIGNSHVQETFSL